MWVAPRPACAQCPSGGGGGNTYVMLPIADAVLPDGTTDNIPGNALVQKGIVTGGDPFWYAIELSQTDSLQWSIWIPDNYSSDPVFTVFVNPSTAIGTFSFSVGVRCLTLDANESVFTNDFDTVNTDATITFSGADAADSISITLTNDDSMEAEDWCTFEFIQNSSALATYVMGARFSFTGS